MRVECFLDTNVLVYAVDNDPAGLAKKKAAMELLEHADFGLSAQVLQEFYVTVTRKIEVPLSPDEALAYLVRLEVFPSVPVDAALITGGIRNSVRYQISYWDGAILAAAVRLASKTVYSEDLNHGQRYGDVEVVNPFIGVSE
ncbi:MAG: PIN domain-containing protein [Opitutales bacterium]